MLEMKFCELLFAKKNLSNQNELLLDKRCPKKKKLCSNMIL